MTGATIHGVTTHGPDCLCHRCAGFQPGNQVRETHGYYNPLRLQPRAKEIREASEPLVPFAAESDGALLDLASMTPAQVERAGLVLAYEQAQGEPGDPPSERLDRLAKDARLWANSASRLLDQLGLSPASRARLAGISPSSSAP